MLGYKTTNSYNLSNFEQLNTKRKFIGRWLSELMLVVFSIALTPWNALHHHPEVTAYQNVEKSCVHRLHLTTHVERCLVCEAHFDKDFINVTATLQVFISSTTHIETLPILGSVYAELIHTSLRGPPVATI
jgi:hypothetical protein